MQIHNDNTFTSIYWHSVSRAKHFCHRNKFELNWTASSNNWSNKQNLNDTWSKLGHRLPGFVIIISIRNSILFPYHLILANFWKCILRNPGRYSRLHFMSQARFFLKFGFHCLEWARQNSETRCLITACYLFRPISLEDCIGWNRQKVPNWPNSYCSN